LPEAPVRRAYQVYLYTVCFVAVLVFLFAASLALFGVVRIAFPEQTGSTGVFGQGLGGSLTTGIEEAEQKQGFAQLIENAILAGIAGLVFGLHWRRAGTVRDSLEEAGEP
jgi:hypothetical protein